MMTDGNSQAIAKHLDERDEWDALQEVTVELEQAESDNILLISRIEELEAKLAKAVEALEWQADAIHNSVTVNMKHNHRILLDGTYHEGPLVDWVHKILTGFEAINRTTLAELKGQDDDSLV
jgi:hypothetical protein